MFLTCPTGKLCSLRNSNNRRSVKLILLDEKLLGLVEMMSGLVNASFSLPEWQAVKMVFFAPCKTRLSAKTFWVKMKFICMRIQKYFHIISLALGLALKQRSEALQLLFGDASLSTKLDSDFRRSLQLLGNP